MQKTEIKIGVEYALREARKADAPVQHVRIVAHVRGKKWKAEWIEPNPGLIEYIESQHLLVPWRDRKAFLRDEERERQLRADNERHGYQEDSPLANALSEVFGSVGEQQVSFYRGVLSGPPDALERVKERAGIDLKKDSSVGYVDRNGTADVPLSAALELAKAFCAVELRSH